MKFPDSFLWGAAASAYQIEGAVAEDGRGPCIWDVLSEGHIRNGDTAAVACDHYHRVREDIALMKQIGLKTYRMSISWPRIYPDGTGKINQAGLDFYNEEINALLEAGIEPLITLYHWELPYALYLKGGWTNPESPAWFETFTRTVVDAFSDRVQWWMTFNEPQCFVGISYVGEEHAPFLEQPSSLAPVTRNVLLAHGLAVKTIRARAKKPPKVSFASTGTLFLPHDDSAAEIARAEAETFGNRRGPFSTAWWTEPLYAGKFTPDAAKQMGLSDVHGLLTPEEWALAAQPLDYIAFNIYHAEGLPVEGSTYLDNSWQGAPRTAMDWPVTPDAIYWATRFMNERYHLPVLISENGMANVDFVMLDGKVHDPQRIDYMHRYLRALGRAVEEGYPVLGYMYWSTMDNFEWANGYAPRFGLVYVDYRTQQRILKDSAYWYAEVIRTNGANL